jgi:hypothetical protein
MTVMTENKLKTNEQEEEVKKWFLEPPFAVKKIKIFDNLFFTISCLSRLVQMWTNLWVNFVYMSF